MKPVRERISKLVEKWYIIEPLFFATWSLHTVIPSAYVKTIRCGAGKVEYNPDFLNSLSKEQLYEVLCFEAMRMILKHPYSRKKEIDTLSYQASNITVQEYLRTSLGFQYAQDVFFTSDFDKKHFEFYYDKLLEQFQNAEDLMNAQGSLGAQKSTADSDSADSTHAPTAPTAPTAPPVHDSQTSQASPAAAATPSASQPTLEDYRDNQSGNENCETWEKNDYFENLINEKIMDVQVSNQWGHLTRNLKEKILATLKPKVDYRSILKSFRASVLSVSRTLTRMKPSRRYGFQYLGSKRDFTTKLLFAVDVSGSISNKDLVKGFSIINRFFKYGVQQMDVISFDTEIKGETLSLKKARKEMKVLGRGGTCFQPLMDYLDMNRDYDGLIIFTDGYATVPTRPKNKRTRIVWLFNNERNYHDMKNGLLKIGKVAFVKGK